MSYNTYLWRHLYSNSYLLCIYFKAFLLRVCLHAWDVYSSFIETTLLGLNILPTILANKSGILSTPHLQTMLGLANICGAVRSLRSQKYNIESWGGREGKWMNETSAIMYKCPHLFLSKIVGLNISPGSNVI